MAKLTKANRARLEKLAAYLEGLPADYRHFDMGTYYRGTASKERAYARKNGGLNCDTVACAVGHGPAAGVLVPPRFVGASTVNWGIDGYATLFCGKDSCRYHWLFDSSWDFIDNNHFGAAARIRYLLDKGTPPARELYYEPEATPLYAPYRIDAPVPA